MYLIILLLIIVIVVVIDVVESSHSIIHISFGFYQNCRGLKTKCTQFRWYAVSIEYLFLVFTETWLYDGTFGNKLNLSNYNIYIYVIGIVYLVPVREVVVSLLVYLRKEINFQLIPYNDSNVEHQFVSQILCSLMISSSE